MSAVWHDLECGGYAEDLALWRSLASQHADPILEIGAGTGRVAIELARAGHRVTALDTDPDLLAELERRSLGLTVATALGDARSFELRSSFGLCIVPMQTIQLFGGPAGRRAFLTRARNHLSAGGLLAAAIAERLEPYEIADGYPLPVPDMCERDGVVYSSQPTAIRARTGGFELERRRETVTLDGSRTAQRDAITLDLLSASELEREAVAIGFTPAGRTEIPPTTDYAGSEVVMLRA